MSQPFPPPGFQPPMFQPFAVPSQATGMTRVNGRHPPGAADIGMDVGVDMDRVLEGAVVRRIRRQVAERLTDATRAAESGSGAPMPQMERERLIGQFISDALDAFAAEGMAAGRVPLRPDEESRIARTVADSLLGAGGLQPWLNHPDVEEITCNGCDVVFVRYADGSHDRVGPVADSDDDMVDLVRLLAARSGVEERRWDRAAPILNLQLPDGSRLNAVMAVTKRPCLSIRRHRYLTMSMPELVKLGTIDTALQALLAAAVAARLNIIVGGATGAGKTTFLRGLASVIEPWERLVTVEDTYELGFDLDTVAHPNVVPMQAREANVEGEGAVDMSTLFRNALRMVPSRVFVGEVRGNEIIPMLNALSQGNDGSLSTIHASSSGGIFRKLALYAAQSPERLDQATTNMHIAEGVHLVVHLQLTERGERFVTSVREVVDADGVQVVSNEIFRPGPDGRAVPGAPMSTTLAGRLEYQGFEPALLQRRQGWWDLTRRHA